LSFLLCLFLLVGCSARQKAMRALRGTEKALNAADQAVLTGNIEDAKQLYQRAEKALLQKQSLFESSPVPLRQKAESLREALQLRREAWESPEGALRASFALAGDEETEDLAFFFWDFEAMSELILGVETWQQLPIEAREQVPSLSEQLLRHFTSHNRSLFQNIQIHVKKKTIQGNKARMNCSLLYGKTRLDGDVFLLKRDAYWKVLDVDMNMLQISRLLGDVFRSVDAVRPLEEALLAENISEILVQASQMALDESEMAFSEGGNVVTLVVDSVLELDNGQTLPMYSGRMVEVLEESRKIGETKQVRIRALGVVREDGTEGDGSEGVAGSTIGWISEEALPLPTEEDVWALQ